MAKKKTIINPEQGIRLKRLLQEENIKQRELSEEIEKYSYRTLSQQKISDIINGRAPLIFEVADVISNLPRFKDKDLLREWLLCEENFKSSDEKALNETIASRYEGDMLLTGISCFLNLAGYEVTSINQPFKEELKETGFELSRYKIEKDNSVVELSSHEMFSYSNKVLHLFEVFTHDYFN